jgi:hypothetical protein
VNYGVGLRWDPKAIRDLQRAGPRRGRTARFRAIDQQGQTIFLGTEEDTSETPAEALSAVLDRVDLRFFRPYRL